MKKSVLLPFDRYQQLLNNSPSTQPSSKSPPPTAPQVESLTEVEEPTPSSSDKLNRAVIVTCLPKRNRQKAQRLLDFIDSHTYLDWNKEGNLLVENQPISYSHIVDLLHDALNTTRYDPVGYDTFYHYLEGVPLSLINNPRRKSMVGGRSPPPGLPNKEPKPLNVWKSQWKVL